MRIQHFLLWIFFFSAVAGKSQETHHVNGMHHPNNIYYAFKNATVFVDYQTKIENATVLIKDEKIVAVGQEVEIPSNTKVFDLEGNYIYPSFIELDSDYGLPGIKKKKQMTVQDLYPQYQSKKPGAYSWNEAVKPEQNAYEQF